jgi:hypothetical protein
MHPGHLFPFSAGWPASSLPSFAPFGTSRHWSPGGASTRSGLGGLFADDCHCCNQRVLILRLGLVEMVAGRCGSSSGTHCWAQESWELARGAGSAAGDVAGWELLGPCWLLGVLGRLGQVLVQLINCLTFVMPSPMTLSIHDSADLRQKRACRPSR